MKFDWKKLLCRSILSTIVLSNCASTVPLTTELQARSSDKTKVQKAAEIFQLKNKKFKPVQYQIFDSEGIFAKNKITARYRDKGSNVDFTLKLRFDYDQNMITLLSQCFVDQKIEINRYSDLPQAVIELSFQSSYQKEDFGMKSSQIFPQSQILEMFSQLQNHILEEIEFLKQEHPEFYENLSSLDKNTLKNFGIVSKKIQIASTTDISSWKKTETYQRDKWNLGTWQRNSNTKIYPNVVIEVTRTEFPKIEISTRLSGDVKDPSFFQDLRSLGLQI